MSIVVYNNDILGALKSLKKKQQKEGVFRELKGRKNFVSSQAKKKERLTEIIRRKLKVKNEEFLRSSVVSTEKSDSMPFMFVHSEKRYKVADDNTVKIFDTNGRFLSKSSLKDLDLD